MITLDVLGIPAPKGSGRAMNIGGRARFIASSSSANARKQTAWVRAVQAAAIAAGVSALTGAVRVVVAFRMPRPKGHRTKRGELRASAPLYPTVAPDVDKTLRCTLDALTGIAFADDAQVVEVVARKGYAVPGREGASITVEAA